MLKALLSALLLATAVAMAQTPADPAARTNAQREAMTVIASMNGASRIEATTRLPGRGQRTITQTERIGDAEWPEQGAVPPR